MNTNENFRPNIIMILMDDLGWRDLGCSGSTFYETPRIDALCSEGMRFDRAYASCPVCSPSRASYLSGRYPVRTGVTDWIDTKRQYHPMHGKLIDADYLHHIPDDCVTVAEVLRRNGYQTWHVGKWHLGTSEYYPENFGFDVNVGGCWWGHPLHGYFSPWGIETLEEGKDGDYLIDRLTDEAIKLIENADDRPFFLNLCHYAVHEPVQAKQEDIDYFVRKREKWGLDKINPIVDGEPNPTFEHRDAPIRRRVVQSNPVYAAMLKNLDDNVGRLEDTLKKLGIFENTMIIFTSDNGGLSTESAPTCNAPASEGKGWLYEGGTRVPTFAVWQGVIPGGTVSSVPVNTPDFFPTFLDAAGIEKMPDLHRDGVSFFPVFKGEKPEDHPMFWHYPHYGNQGGTPGGSVICGRYKLIEFFEDFHTELYDIESDVGEKRDLSEELPEVRGRLLGMLHKWQIETGAVMPTVNPDAGK